MSELARFAAAVMAAARRDGLRRLRDPFALALWIGIPLVIGGMIVLATGQRASAQPRAKLLLVSHDDDLLSELLVDALVSGRAGVVEAELLEEPDARARIEAGEASALLVIPAGFTNALWNEWPVTLELVTNPSQRILPGVIEEALSIFSESVFYAHRVLAPDLRAVVDASLSGGELEIAAASVALRRSFERVGKYVFPPVIELESSVRSDASAPRSRSLAGWFLPAMLMMALLFMADGMADDVWREKLTGVLRRVGAGPLGALPSLLGKLLAAWALMALVAGLACAVAAAMFAIPALRALLATLWASTCGAAFFGLFAWMKTFASSQRAAGIVGNLLLFPLLMIGGSFMPFAMMPAALADVGRLTPNGAAVAQLDALLFGAYEPFELALSFTCAVVLVALLAWAAARRVGGVFARGAE